MVEKLNAQKTEQSRGWWVNRWREEPELQIDHKLEVRKGKTEETPKLLRHNALRKAKPQFYTTKTFL